MTTQHTPDMAERIKALETQRDELLVALENAMTLVEAFTVPDDAVANAVRKQSAEAIYNAKARGE